MAKTLDILVSVHNFQHRFNWMCSSIVQQCDDKIPVIQIDIAHQKGNGNPTCGEIANFFTHNYGLNFRLTTYDDTEELQYRGLVRNRQIRKSKAEWIMFADCDIIYSHTFLVCLKKFMDRNGKEDMMYHLGRFSCKREESDRMVGLYRYPCLVHNPGNLCANMTLKKMRNVGAGYCQIIRRKAIDNLTGGIYVDPAKCRDESWKKIQKARSDHQFRHMVPHRKIAEEEFEDVDEIKKLRDKDGKLKFEDKPLIFHLNHFRDNEMKKHLEEQR